MAVVREPGQASARGVRGPRRNGPAADRSDGDRRERTVIRLSPQDKQRAGYWAEKRGFSSVNEYMAEAVSGQIRRENGDYDLPTLEIARLNQLVDEITTLSTNVANLERVVIQVFDSFVSLTRGDNYLLDDENGDLL